MATYSEVVEGLAILEQYDDSRHGVYAEHDVIYAGPVPALGDAEEMLADEHRDRLKELGWFVDSDSGGWAIFV